MARVQVQLNHSGMASLLKDPGVQADLMARMENVLAAAKASAPFVTGAHRDSGHIEAHEGPTRVSARVVFDSDHSLEVEARTGHIGRSLDAAGGA